MISATKEYNLLKVNPMLARQWHPKKNGKLRPQDVTPHAGRDVWWLCEKGHEWQAVVNVRSQGNGCPFCSGHGRYKLDSAEWAILRKSVKLGEDVSVIGKAPSGRFAVSMSKKALENVAILTLPPKKLGPLVYEYRIRHGISQVGFAQLAGLHRNSIGLFEKGQIENFSYPTIQRIISVILGE